MKDKQANKVECPHPRSKLINQRGGKHECAQCGQVWVLSQALSNQRKEMVEKADIDYTKPENKYSEFPKEYVGYNKAIDDIINLIEE